MPASCIPSLTTTKVAAKTPRWNPAEETFCCRVADFKISGMDCVDVRLKSAVHTQRFAFLHGLCGYLQCLSVRRTQSPVAFKTCNAGTPAENRVASVSQPPAGSCSPPIGSRVNFNQSWSKSCRQPASQPPISRLPLTLVRGYGGFSARSSTCLSLCMLAECWRLTSFVGIFKKPTPPLNDMGASLQRQAPLNPVYAFE